MRQAPRRSLAAALMVAFAITIPQTLRSQASRQVSSTAVAPSPNFTAEDALEVMTYSIADLSDDGQWLVVTGTSRRDTYGADYRRDGDPSYLRVSATKLLLIDTKTGAARPIFADKRNVRLVRWAPDGRRLAMLVLTGDALEPVIWDRTTGKTTPLRAPAGKYVAENSDLRWTGDGKQIVVMLRSDDWKKKVRETFSNMTGGPVFVQSSTEPFLAWDDLRRMGNTRSVVAFDATTGQTRELIPEMMIGSYTLAEDGTAIAYAQDIAKKTDYDSFGSETSLKGRLLTATDSKTLLATTKGAQVVWAEDGKRFAYSKEGRVFVSSIDGAEAKQVAGPAEQRRGETPDTSKAARDRAAKERFSVVRYSPAGDALLVSNREGMWLLDLASGNRDLVIATNDSSQTSPRISIATWSRDGQTLYFTKASRSEWERGFVRYDRTAKRLQELMKDGRNYNGLRLSKDGKTAVLSIAAGNRPADIYVADAELGSLRRVVESNPQLQSKRIGPTELVSFLDADGHRKYAVVYYPGDYQKGKAYPTIFNVYEDFFDDSFDVRTNVLTGHGYVVVQPSVDFDIGYPGEAWLKGVTAAANKLIEMGVTDSARMGVQGQSYGGYATNLLVTQTNRFKAAINISGKVDLISFYTDSPRLGVRNVNAAEKTQDRIGATMWQQPQKYVQHSAVMFADRITTPLMLITGAQDSNVPADNTREMYYALRRLGKECVWVNYMNGGHGGGTATAEDFLDMQRRMLQWYDSKLTATRGKVTSN
jgi:dipeptidyl aminopeptidase/acylaminoacyl peptidase